MQARGPLMIEHRLIERMLSVIRDVLGQIESTRKVDPVFIDTAVDFIRTYASSGTWTNCPCPPKIDGL